MTRANESKRSFFKKLAITAGVVSVSGYLGKVISARTNPIQLIKNNSENDVMKQKNAWLRTKLIVMTDNEKKQMLDEILDTHGKYKA